MTHQYQLSGLTCNGCSASVKNILSKIPGIQSVQINDSRDEATVTMTQHVGTETLKAALKPYAKYQLEDKALMQPVVKSVAAHTTISADAMTDTRSWLETYKPLLLILGYVTLVTCIAAHASWILGMQYFMAGFFLVFSFFKMLDLSGFAASYSMYDIIAQKIPSYGFVYPFIELGLGIAYLTGFNPVLTNSITLIVMGLSILGVVQSVMSKRKIKCACLGSVFNLPMTTVTIVEDGLMIVMAATMLLMLQHTL